jgi:hypothetical protein
MCCRCPFICSSNFLICLFSVEERRQGLVADTSLSAQVLQGQS